MANSPESPADSPPGSGGPGSAAQRGLAIALDQDAAASGPRVVAKGRGKLAEQILAIAFERGVKVRTDADLAEILEAVELDSEVPLVALAAVAEILTYVYRANAAPAGGARP